MRPHADSNEAINIIRMTIMERLLPEAIEAYAAAHSRAPSALLREIEAYTVAHCADAEMLIGALEGALLQMLVELSGARRILEIGLFTGYSALTMAEALPPDGRIVSCEIDPARARIAQGFFDRSPHGGKIAVRVGPALETLQQLRGERFDFVFIDADKENYPAYYELALPLLPAGGIIVADNVLWSGRVLDPQNPSDYALKTFNRRAAEDPRVTTSLLTVRDGVLVIRKK